MPLEGGSDGVNGFFAIQFGNFFPRKALGQIIAFQIVGQTYLHGDCSVSGY